MRPDGGASAHRRRIAAEDSRSLGCRVPGDLHPRRRRRTASGRPANISFKWKPRTTWPLAIVEHIRHPGRISADGPPSTANGVTALRLVDTLENSGSDLAEMLLVHLTASRFFGGPERQMLELAKGLPPEIHSHLHFFFGVGTLLGIPGQGPQRGFRGDRAET